MHFYCCCVLLLLREVAIVVVVGISLTVVAISIYAIVPNTCGRRRQLTTSAVNNEMHIGIGKAWHHRRSKTLQREDIDGVDQGCMPTAILTENLLSESQHII